MRIELFPAGCALLLLLGGCTTTTTPTRAAVAAPAPAPAAPPPATNIVTEPVAAPAPPPATPADQVLAYGERIRALPQADLAQEVQRLGEAPATPVRSLQLALALTQQRNAAQAPRIQSLLQRVLAQQDAESQSLHPLARLLTEQRRLEDQAERQAQQLRDQQRRIEQLNERLEAVRAIERSLPAQPATRENGAAPARRPASAASRPAS